LFSVFRRQAYRTFHDIRERRKIVLEASRVIFSHSSPGSSPEVCFSPEMDSIMGQGCSGQSNAALPAAAAELIEQVKIHERIGSREPAARDRQEITKGGLMAVRLLILGAGSVASNNFIRSLKGGDPSMEAIGCASDRFSLQRSLSDRKYLIPKSGPQLLRALKRIIRAEKIDLVVGNSDADVEMLSKNRERLPCRTFLPEQEVIERCRDKFELATFLARRRIRVPKTYAVERVDQLDFLFQRLSSHAQLWCRIRKGSGSIGAIPVRTADQARWWIQYWEQMRGVPPGMFTLSEYLPGRDITVQCVFKRGVMYISKMLHRISYNVIGGGPSGISSTAALAKMIHERRIATLCEKAITVLDAKANGAFSVDLREDAQGKPCITEINAGRFANGPVVHDVTGEPSTVLTYVRLALGQSVTISRSHPYANEEYILRHLDIPPAVISARDLSNGVEELSK
jgi:glutathione synthase/RimK-type ligase-like ATP-grasp enzyme